jgi:uncharacterized protein (TIGR02246 family)
MTDETMNETHMRRLYERILEAWNSRSGDGYAAAFAEDGVVVGFDGSHSKGPTAIAEEMNRIFADHATGRYVGIVREVRSLGNDVALLHAVAGVVPAGRSDVAPDLNSIQALVAERQHGEWRAVLYQNTPAQFHGRPELAESLTQQLREALKKAR